MKTAHLLVALELAVGTVNDLRLVTGVDLLLKNADKEVIKLNGGGKMQYHAA